MDLIIVGNYFNNL